MDDVAGVDEAVRVGGVGTVAEAGAVGEGGRGAQEQSSTPGTTACRLQMCMIATTRLWTTSHSCMGKMTLVQISCCGILTIGERIVQWSEVLWFR